MRLSPLCSPLPQETLGPLCVCVCLTLRLLRFSQAWWPRSGGSWALLTYITSLASWRLKPHVEHRGVRDTRRLGLAACVQRVPSPAEKELQTGAARGRASERGPQRPVHLLALGWCFPPAGTHSSQRWRQTWCFSSWLLDC